MPTDFKRLYQPLVEQEFRQWRDLFPPDAFIEVLIEVAAAWLVRVDQRRIAAEIELETMRQKVIAKALEPRCAD